MAARQVWSAWIDGRVEIGPSGVDGQGMFARETIRAGEAVLRWGGTVFTEVEIRAGLARPGSAAQIEPGIYLADPVDGPESPDYCLNHSCDPNLWMGDAVTLVARRDISAGEELCVDYAVWETDPGWQIASCRCGTALCRGTVTGEDWKRPDLQERYAGHFTPFVQSLMLDHK